MSLPVKARGAEAFETWTAFKDDDVSDDTFEYPLYTDAELVGEVVEGFGPYQVVNAVAGPGFRPYVPSAFLRIRHRVGTLGPMTETDATRHHGGFLQDEVAALLSLELGVRLKSAGATRWFREGHDPKGRPWAFEHFRAHTPNLLKPVTGAVIPHLERTQDLSHADRSLRLLDLRPEDSVALVRAARLYQDALWIVDSEPELTWLLLVSALETAAVHWRSATDEPVDRLRISKPKLAELLEKEGGPKLLEKVAEEIAPYMGSTKKFIDFVLTFLPEPPIIRPKGVDQFPWEIAALKRMLSKVYDYRSKALHTGAPFPTPMCMPPRLRAGEMEERPLGGAVAIMGSVWMAEDIPIMLHLFERIGRGALLRWWDSMLAASTIQRA